jgi:preprotein translocase subunit SecG
MTQVLLVIHLVVTVVMIGLILLQRSEGGGLGVGGGNGGLGGFAGPRATANALSRATMVCFALFVGLSLILAIMAGSNSKTGLIDQLAVPASVQGQPVTPTDEPIAPGLGPVGEPLRPPEKSSIPIAD